VVVSAAIQEFFGIAVLEAAYCGAVPLLPRRLAYPELVPPAWHEWCLYERDELLVPALRAALQRPRPLARSLLRTWAARFDWQQMAPEYDAKIAHCVALNG
jgi:glycosyltransferase involved in cell wall biosynthesis